MPNLLVLDGCSPTPLISYLKAVGVLRLLSSTTSNASIRSADPRVRGWWKNEHFHLETALTRDEVLRYFLEDYAPSPIIAPWNGRAGFLEGAEQEISTRAGGVLMRQLGNSQAHRFTNLRRTIENLRNNSELTKLNQHRMAKKKLNNELNMLKKEERKYWDAERKIIEKKEKQSKRALLPALRSEAEPNHVSFIDACYVLSGDGVPMPLLGSGGNDGSRDFGMNFADKLTKLFDLKTGCATALGISSLEGSLFGGGRSGICETMGQFSPGQGGSNATTGYEGSNPLNPWDFVLGMEGTIVFAGAVTRSWGVGGSSRAAFPFTFDPILAADGNFSTEDPNRPRGEIWVPLWKKPASFIEIEAIFSEGRLTLGGHTARTGLDAARAVAQMGLARGISSFERYSIIQPDSKMPFQATPLGRIATPSRPSQDLIVDLEFGNWLSSAQQLTGSKKNAPSRARHAIRRLEDSLFRMTEPARASEGTRNALVAIGNFVDWLSTNPKIRKELNPPPRLSSGWIFQADDGTPEFRVAAALASLGLNPSAPSGRSKPISPDSTSVQSTAADPETAGREEASTSQVETTLPMAVHFAPINEDCFFNGVNLDRRRAWAADTPPTAVWGGGSLVSNMVAVLERRLIEATMRGLPDKPLASASFARISDVVAFLDGNFDDERCAALLAGLVWAAPARSEHRTQSYGVPVIKPPFAYAALKPIFSTGAALRWTGAFDETDCPQVPPGLLARLCAGGENRDGRATHEAVLAALGRFRASGLTSPFERMSSDGRASGRFGVGIRADRLAASLLIPIGNHELKVLLAGVWPDTQVDDSKMEETTSAA